MHRSGLSLILALSTLVAVTNPVIAGPDEEISRWMSRLKRDPNDRTALMNLGGQYALRASEQGFPSDIDEARRHLDQSERQGNRSAKLTAWRGILRLIEAKIRGSKTFAKEGLSLLDRAVEQEPESLIVRMMRGSADLEVPREFNRLDQAMADLMLIETAYARDPHSLRKEDLEPGEVHLKLGNGYRAKGDLQRAQEMWQRVLTESPRGKEADSARRQLKKFGDGRQVSFQALR